MRVVAISIERDRLCDLCMFYSEIGERYCDKHRKEVIHDIRSKASGDLGVRTLSDEGTEATGRPARSSLLLAGLPEMGSSGDEDAHRTGQIPDPIRAVYF